MTFTQANTILQIATPFGADAMLLTRFYAEERLSSLFHFHLDLVSQSKDLKFDQILGKSITVKLKLAEGKSRFFHGMVTRFSQTGRVGKLTSYRAEVHPKLWLLSRTTDSRIFQDVAVPDIIGSVLSDHGVDSVKKDLKRSYDKRTYCVQYQESCLDFVSRLLEDEGIFYYFEHQENNHVLVLGDHPSAHATCENLSKVRYRGEVATSVADEDIVTTCELTNDVVVGAYAVSDYNFELPPGTSLLGKVDGSDAKLQVFEYPGNHATKSAGDVRAKLRLEEQEAVGKTLVGNSYCRGMSAGHAFALTEHERNDANTDYILQSVVHEATGETYSNRFKAFPKAVPYRPPRTTRKPVIIGSQTAIVTGKDGEEIWTDKYGRIKVHFHWDRHGEKNESSSCWIRVAQSWAGKTWGAFFLPRIGQEVVVSFLGGDPDAPLVTGSVYNAFQTVPYALPGEQTKSTVKSRSSKDGSEGNELRFEDKKDSEEVFLHAQKDMNVTINNDHTVNVDHDETWTVKNNRSATISEGDEELTVAKGKRTVAVKEGEESHSVKGKRTVKVDGEEKHTTHGAFEHHSEDSYTLKVDGDLTLDVKGSITIKSAQSIQVKAGMSLTNKAGTSLTNDAVSVTNKASASQTVDGGGMLVLKGGVVKLN